MKDHPFKLPLYPFSNYFAFAMLIVIVIFMFINPDTRVSVIVGAVVLLVAMAVYIHRWGLSNTPHSAELTAEVARENKKNQPHQK